MILNLLMMVAGLGLLAWSSDRFVYGASALARNIGLPPLIIGLTIVSMGSSAPEAMVSAAAAVQGNLDTAIGNVIGSNIANITLVLGASALIRALTVGSSTLIRELPLMLLATMIAGYLLHDEVLSYADGFILLGAFFTILAILTISTWRQHGADPLSEDSDAEIPKNVSTLVACGWLLAGMVLMPLAANWMVEGGSNIAKWFGLSDLVIGLTIIAVGTSLPELATCIAAVLKHEDDLVIGNIIGSNLFNILAVLAIPALIAPGAIDAAAAGRDFYFMLATSLLPLLLLLLKGSRTIGRLEGGLLLILFIGYQANLLFFTS